MIGTIRIVWDGPGVLVDRGREVAGPGDSLIVDHIKAEEYVRQGKAHYSRRQAQGR